MKAIENGQVASLVLAGGQGTRLGFSGPKGCLDIGLPSGRTLFELMALRICKLQLLTNGIIPFYIMTSPLNHEETLSFFERKKYFGLEPGNVFFFQQGMLPCLTEEGKIIMESAGKVAMAPDGNGGIYPSLVASGALDDMTNRGVQYLHVFSIDNALVKPADPKFIGYCIDQKADCGNKVVWKVDAHEKVGVVAERSGRPCIVEYSEITREMAEKTDSSGRLVFGAGNICNHFYTIDFVKNKILPNMGSLYHIANKKIPYYDEVTNKTITPDSNNGIKLETFIFDVFPLSERMAVLDVEREEEFAPVKNKAGSPSDSPDTARSMISALAKKWVRDAGGILTGELDAICEISPLTSYAGENLEFLQDKEVACPFHI
jgi:UDP-N-acetylglucosamine/UDP-N-acetylgalactosamine diphosphorylase